MRFVFQHVVLFLLLALVAGDTLRANAWQQKSPQGFVDASDFPEMEMLSGKSNVAITFSGGGARAYIAAVGQLAALHSLGLIPKIRYISGISGGSWASSVFSFSQNRDISDDELLGGILPPSELSSDKLSEMSPACMRSFVADNGILRMMKALNDSVVTTLADAWTLAVQQIYLDKIGVPTNTFYAYTQHQVDDIKKRNPSLANSTFILPRDGDRPFPIIGSTLIGPTAGSPYFMDEPKGNANVSFIEFTPMYIGHMKTLDIEYKYAAGVKHKKRVGGFIESFAFPSKGTAPVFGLKESETLGTLNVPVPSVITDLARSVSASSYFAGMFLSSLPDKKLPEDFGDMEFDYWSPSDRTPSESATIVGDGGNIENINIISFLQRRVEKIVMFSNVMTPLYPPSEWNVDTDEYTGKELDISIAAFFGVYKSFSKNITQRLADRGYDYTKNQVFAESDFSVLVKALQNAQEIGDGIIATLDLVTIENAWWGIPSGISVELTLIYLGRLKNWESQLSPEMVSLLVPSDPKDASNLAIDIDSGHYKNFPHYTTTIAIMEYDRANALADLTGWAVLQNAKLFQNIFS